MIPVRLALKNFMPYRDNVPPLYFTDIHTASIWGDNGNGKSSLIDAITWALWGKTRAKSDDDIIHLGRNETEVEFDFTVSGILYRVIRKHALPKKRQSSGQSLLELQISSGDGFRSVTGNTIAQTQQEVIDILHMDYATFVNSAYLRQGHADEFTQQQPVKRKEVLANILGLSRYDKLEEAARELARKQETEKTLAENAIRDMGEELAQRPVWEAELKKVQTELADIDGLIKEKEKTLNELRQKKELMDSRRQQVIQIDRHMADSIRMKELLAAQIKQLNTRIHEFEAIINRGDIIEDGYSRYAGVKKLNEELDRKFRLVSALGERKHKLEMEIVRSSQALLSEHTLVENQIARLDETCGKLPVLRNELQKAQSELNGLAVEEETVNRKKQELRDLQTGISDLQSVGTRLDSDIREISEKLNLLSSQSGAKCPLCERELGEEHRILIETKYFEEKQLKADLLRNNREELTRKTTGLKSAEVEILQIEKRLAQAKTSTQSKINLYIRDIQEIEKAGVQLVEERTRLGEIEQRISSRDYAVEEQESLRRLDRELAGMDYDAANHEKIRQELTDLAQYEEPKRRLDEALKNIKADKESELKAEETAAGLDRNIGEDKKRKEELTAEIALLPEITAKLNEAESEYRNLATKQKQSQESAGRLKGLLQRSAELETRLKEKKKQLEQAVKEEQIYHDLSRAFGKRGIQIWLIETAIPEIEIEANKLLERMTDNRMHIKIETQRETKKGSTLETLDIRISDELGTRNYEMFSGGEAFRIDFAIRIALSKLLARRAGAPLPTLIIDEGFGTQDANGLEKLKEAIISIQDDFEKILVVTHIEEFRDAFPTRIDIVKTAEGSTIEVN